MMSIYLFKKHLGTSDSILRSWVELVVTVCAGRRAVVNCVHVRSFVEPVEVIDASFGKSSDLKQAR